MDEIKKELPRGLQNPFFKDERWYWFDETGKYFGPYDTKKEAAKHLNDCIIFLNKEFEA